MLSRLQRLQRMPQRLRRLQRMADWAIHGLKTGACHEHLPSPDIQNRKLCDMMQHTRTQKNLGDGCGRKERSLPLSIIKAARATGISKPSPARRRQTRVTPKLMWTCGLERMSRQARAKRLPRRRRFGSRRVSLKRLSVQPCSSIAAMLIITSFRVLAGRS
jgi:hypothetical protein